MNKTIRKYVIGGNWKSNNTLAETHALLSNILNKLAFNSERADVLVFPSTIHLLETAQKLTNKNVQVGAQNISKFAFGAYTGETSALHLADLGVHWTLLGHSERRALFSESSELVAEKTRFALENSLKVVLCIGESLQERESQKTLEVIESQLRSVKDKLENKAQWDNIVVAYEPVWAIGTGKVATPAQAQEVHLFIRKWVRENIGEELAQKVRIIYGGSVTEKNCKELIEQGDIDGFLVGGASLKPAFTDIVKITSESN